MIEKQEHFSPLQNLLSKCGLQQGYLDGEHDLVYPEGRSVFKGLSLEIFSNGLPACLTGHESPGGTLILLLSLGGLNSVNHIEEFS